MNVLELAKTLLEKGDFKRLLDLFHTHAFSPNLSAEEYFFWGKIAEELNLLEEAKNLYNKAIFQDPSNNQVLFALAQLHYNTKDYYQAFKILRKLLQLKPSEELQKFFLDVVKKLNLKGILRKWGISKNFEFDPSFLSKLISSEINSLFEHFTLLFKDFEYFAEAGIDNYGNFYIKPSVFRLTHYQLKCHFLGTSYLVGFPVEENLNFSHFFLGIKLSEKFVKRCFNENSFYLLKKEELLSAALVIWEKLQNFGLTAYLERFSPFYYRVWFFLENPLSLSQLKSFFKLLVEKLPSPGGGIIYISGAPKISISSMASVSHVFLPLGIEPITLERSKFIDENGSFPEDQIAFFKKIVPSPREEVLNFIKKSYTFSAPKTKAKVKEELEVLRKHCHFIDYILEKASSGKVLSREEKLALSLTIGFLKNGKTLLHQIFSQCPDYSYRKVENFLKNLPPHPVSCFKIEKWLKEVSLFSPCKCEFGEKLKNKYPCPLLHIDPSLVPTSYSAKNIYELLKLYSSLQDKLSSLKTLIKNHLKNTQTKTLTYNNYIFCLSEEGRLLVKKTFGEKK